MITKLISAFALIFILSNCGKDGVQPPIEPQNNNGELMKARVSGVADNLSIGDSVILSADFETSGQVDTGKIDYSWRIQRNDTLLFSDTGEEHFRWIPHESGQFLLTLDIEYHGKIVSTAMILGVLERIVHVDSNLAGRLQTDQDHLPGYYVGEVNTPWTLGYGIAIAFHRDGTYTSYNIESDQLSALYYGTDSDGPQKTWTLENVMANGNASGNLVILFDVGTTTQDDIRELRFNGNFDTLSFSLWHLGYYGPVRLALHRVDSSEMPARPLPTPSIVLTGNIINQNWNDSVSVSISSRGDLAVLYELLPVPSNPNLLNPMPLWNMDTTFLPYHGSFVVRSGGGNHLLLARATDGMHFSGVAAQILYFAP
jgi:hypothetical protein